MTIIRFNDLGPRKLILGDKGKYLIFNKACVNIKSL